MRSKWTLTAAAINTSSTHTGHSGTSHVALLSIVIQRADSAMIFARSGIPSPAR